MKNTKLYRELEKMMNEAFISDEQRKKLSFYLLNGALAITALVMSVINVCTSENVLLIATASFGLLCVMNLSFVYYNVFCKRVVLTLFGVESIALLGFFIVSGIPNGFSVLWTCLIPSFSLFICGAALGSAYSALALLMIIFLFWTDSGRALLMYSYTDEFMLRFPFLYCSVYAISLLIEIVRRETQKQLVKTKEEYAYLYRHDALTGLYNRYGISEYLDGVFSPDAEKPENFSIIMLDIDDFKQFNDKYGHECGDQVLKNISRITRETMCNHCRCCRWGGEEFLLVMQCGHDPLQSAERVRRKIQESVIVYGGKRLNVTVSLGVCTVKNMDDIDVHDIIDKADDCMYDSKKNGKNRVTSCTV